MAGFPTRSCGLCPSPSYARCGRSATSSTSRRRSGWRGCAQRARTPRRRGSTHRSSASWPTATAPRHGAVAAARGPCARPPRVAAARRAARTPSAAPRRTGTSPLTLAACASPPPPRLCPNSRASARRRSGRRSHPTTRPTRTSGAGLEARSPAQAALSSRRTPRTMTRRRRRRVETTMTGRGGQEARR